MKHLPDSDNVLVIRTDFSDAAPWEGLCAAIQMPVGDFGFKPYVTFVSDPEYDGMTIEQLLAVSQYRSNHSFIFLVDHNALFHPDHPILVVDLSVEPGRTFRVIPSEMWAVENNLSLANMDWEDFTQALDENGIYRGFAEN